MYKHQEITGKVIAAFYNVYNGLGYGFLEKVYENAMMIELKKLGLNAAQQARINVFYEGEVVGEYAADLLVENQVLVELKATQKLADEHEAQLLNYLKATKHEIGLLLNYGPKPQIARKIYDNERKGTMSWVNSAMTLIDTDKH
jgi:GxxExxY protein